MIDQASWSCAGRREPRGRTHSPQHLQKVDLDGDRVPSARDLDRADFFICYRAQACAGEVGQTAGKRGGWLASHRSTDQRVPGLEHGAMGESWSYAGKAKFFKLIDSLRTTAS